MAFQYIVWAGAAIVLCLLAAACSPSRLHAVPVADEKRVSVVGMSDIRDIRFWGDESTPDLIRVGIEAYRREVAARQASGAQGPLPPAEFLAISGGGENGAFGAGLLVGWTAAGTRPSFKLVTGISTGALIAPFAFLGPDYDAKLKEVYTTISGRDVLRDCPACC
jgi:hypothetical protein